MTQTAKHGRVSVFDRDGRLLARWGTPEATKPGSFAAPHGLWVDSRGDVYVGEVVFHKIELTSEVVARTELPSVSALAFTVWVTPPRR